MTVRIVIVDDHALLREVLRKMLDREPDFEVVGAAGSGREALELVEAQHPDLVVMDLMLGDGNGVDTTREIVRRRRGTKVIALSAYSQRRLVLAVLEAGAAGFVRKADSYSELREAVRAVQAGQKYLCAGVTGSVVDAHVGAPDSAFAKLTTRQRLVLSEIARGRSSGEIARELHLSPHTVETHRRNLMRKLGLHSVADLTRYAIREGLTTAEE
ncbi:MAG: response regulator transcription factor [Planctomycetes bacterium]|nr:response regulator transcription factor [Planctomycetota bacterium]